jgi:hypothetical protein
MSEELPTCDPEELIEETDGVDFKATFNPSSKRDWCELVKDFVAMANSGGGIIAVGLNDDGTPSGTDLESVLAVDPAQVTDKVHMYTEQQFAKFAIRSAQRHGAEIALISIGGARFPLCFVRPGQYEIDGRTKAAFQQGTVYFRHGAKSEPGTTDDFRLSMERELQRVKEFWLSGIAKVVEAPSDSVVEVRPAQVEVQTTDGATSIRLTRDENAQSFKVIEFDSLYPYRQKELMQRLREELGSNAPTTHDLRIFRVLNNVDANPTFSEKSKFGSRQYSDALVDWMLSRHREDPAFFHEQRETYKRLKLAQ